MPSHDATRAPDPVPADRRLSRRSLLRGSAVAGATGLAVTAMGAMAGPALADSRRPSAPGLPSATDLPSGRDEAALPHEPIVVHVRDAKSGDIEVFSGTSQTRLQDKDLAARIARAIG
jgi:hypothetical protein